MSGNGQEHKDKVAALRANWLKREEERKKEAKGLSNTIDRRRKKSVSKSPTPVPPSPSSPPSKPVTVTKEAPSPEPDELVFKSPGPSGSSAYALDPFQLRDPMEDVVAKEPAPSQSPISFEPAPSPTSTFAEEAKSQPLGDTTEEQSEKYRDMTNPLFSRLKDVVTPENIDSLGKVINQRFGLNLPVNRMKRVFPTLIPFFEKHGNRIFGGTNPEGFHSYSAEGARVAELLNDAAPVFYAVFEALFTDEEGGAVAMTPQDRARLATVQNEISPAGTSDFLKGVGGSPTTPSTNVVQINPPPPSSPSAQPPSNDISNLFANNPFLNPPSQQSNTVQFTAPPAPPEARRTPPPISQKSSFFMSEAELLAEHRKKYGAEVDGELAAIKARDDKWRGVSAEQQVQAEMEAVRQREQKMSGGDSTPTNKGIDELYKSATTGTNVDDLYKRGEVKEEASGAKKINKRDNDLADEFLNR